MNKLLLTVVATAIVGAFCFSNPQPASALPQFKKQFDDRYMTDGSALKTALNKTNCNICHVGKDRKKRNAYGMALSKHITKDDKSNADKIVSALEKVESEPSDGPGSPTFGELIKTGKLPVTEEE